MKVSDAIAWKLQQICIDHDISVNKLAEISMLTQSTVQNIVSGVSKNPKLLTIFRICDGLNMTLKDFFDEEYFEKLDRED